MKELVARTPKQLDLCLRLLYSEKVEFFVKVEETTKRKIIYRIGINADEQTVDALAETYRILTS